MNHVVTISTSGGPSFTTSTEAISMAADHMSGRRRKGKDIDEPDDPAGVPGFAAKQLLSIVERIERLEEEKKCIADDIKDVYGEAKANGYDTKALRQCVRLRKMDANEREEEEAILELYKNALGLV